MFQNYNITVRLYLADDTGPCSVVVKCVARPRFQLGTTRYTTTARHSLCNPRRSLESDSPWTFHGISLGCLRTHMPQLLPAYVLPACVPNFSRRNASKYPGDELCVRLASRHLYPNMVPVANSNRCMKATTLPAVFFYDWSCRGVECRFWNRYVCLNTKFVVFLSGFESQVVPNNK